jgi:hypothetical protein
MNYLNIIPYDIYTQIYKYVYDGCMQELIRNDITKRNNKYKNMFVKDILNYENRIYYTSLDIFGMVSLGIITDNNNTDQYYNNNTAELEELYYLSDININNFLEHHYNILTTELPEDFKNATCIKLKLSNISILLGFDTEDIYIPLYYILENDLRTWLELIYYTNKLLNEYLLLNNIVINVDFFTLYRFDTIIENGFVVIVPSFEEYII